MKKIIGILGGTFDPVHKGHMQLAHELLQKHPWEAIRFLPCKQPVLKASTTASQQQRLEMLQLAITDSPQLQIDRREITRHSPSYMAETLASLRQESPQTPLALILGMDAFADLPRWHRWQALLDYAHIIVCDRPNIPFPQNDSQLTQLILQHQTSDPTQLTATIAGLVFLQAINTPHIASRTIRAKVRAGEDVTQEVPQKVYDYINQHSVYTTS